MKKIKFLSATALSLFIGASCSNNSGSETQAPISHEAEKMVEASVGAVENAAPVTSKKYEIKSGVITFESQMEVSGIKISGKKIIYFDDYGTKECEESYKDGALTESFISDGKNRFKLFHANKTIYNAGKAFNGTAMPFNWNEVSQKDKDAGLARQGEKMTVAGKNCETFICIAEIAGMKTTTKYAGWNHILLSMELSSKDMKSTEKAILFEEKDVPADKFTSPANYKAL